MEQVQHLDDIVIPVIEITEGWAATDCATIADCDDAFAYLMSACANIELKMDLEVLKPESIQDGDWLARAKCALKYKKAALRIVELQRAKINKAERQQENASADRRFIDFVRANLAPEQWGKLAGGFSASEEKQVAA